MTNAALDLPAIDGGSQALDRLRAGLAYLSGLLPTAVADQATHVYCVLGMNQDPECLGQHRSWILEALRAEGVQAELGGYKYIHPNPLFRHRIAYGTVCFAWKGLASGQSSETFGPGLCPVAEDLRQRTFLGLNLCADPYSDPNSDQVVAAFRRVWAHLEAGG